MRLVDRVSLDGTARAVAYKNITLNEPCFSAAHRGMGEAQLAYPLALLVESFAQGAGLLLSQRGFFADAGGAASLTVFGEFRGIHLLGRAVPGIGFGMTSISWNAGATWPTWRGRPPSTGASRRCSTI